MSDEWYYAAAGQQQGPTTLDGLVGMIRQGQLTGADLVWRDGMESWTAASQVPELADAFAGGGAPPPPPLAAPAAYPSAPPVQPVGYAQPYRPQYQTYPPGSVPNYLVQSILVTIFCCWPFGIPAIVYAAQVNGKLGQGDYQGALAASKNAKMWSWISFGLGGTVILIYLIAAIIGVANS